MEMERFYFHSSDTLNFIKNTTFLLSKNALMGNFHFHQDGMTLPHETTSKIL